TADVRAQAVGVVRRAGVVRVGSLGFVTLAFGHLDRLKPMRVGIDYRSALLNREGIGRYGRELVRGLVEPGFGPNLGLFGYSLAKRRFDDEALGIVGSGAELCRLRFPNRWMPGLLERLGKGVDDLVGGCQVYHHTQPHRLP